MNRFLTPPLFAALTACATAPGDPPTAATNAPEPPPTSTVELAVQPLALGHQPSLLRAQLEGNEILGLFTLESNYQLEQADRQRQADSFGRHSFSQGAQARLPVPLGEALQLDFSNRLEQRWTQSGVLAAQQRQARAHWREGDLRLVVDARRSSEAASYDCGLDASLSAPVPATLHALAGGPRELQLGGQLCQRSLPGVPTQQAQILSARTGWDDAYGRRSLRLSHAVVHEAARADATDIAASARGIELAAQHAFELAGWSLSQEVALRPAEDGSPSSGWAARSQLSRRVLHMSLTASWQRSDAAIWSLGGAPTPGREASLGLDLSAPLRQWLSPNAAASLSYHRLDPDAQQLDTDDQLRLGVTLGW